MREADTATTITSQSSTSLVLTLSNHWNKTYWNFSSPLVTIVMIHGRSRKGETFTGPTKISGNGFFDRISIISFLSAATGAWQEWWARGGLTMVVTIYHKSPLRYYSPQLPGIHFQFPLSSNVRCSIVKIGNFEFPLKHVRQWWFKHWDRHQYDAFYPTVD